jgi:hypothetical protein
MPQLYATLCNFTIVRNTVQLTLYSCTQNDLHPTNHNTASFFLPRLFSLGCSVSSPSPLGLFIAINALLGLVENVERDDVLPGRQPVLPLLRGVIDINSRYVQEETNY